MKEEDEMFVLCEIKHYLDAMFNSLEALNKKPEKETEEYLVGFIDYCKAYIWKYASELVEFYDNKLDEVLKD